MDLYLGRVRKYGASLADTALPATDNVNTVNLTSTRMGNSGDTSWAGWAISSFTNKMATARGEMQPSVNGSTSIALNESHSASLPASGRTTPATLPYSSKPGAVVTEQGDTIANSASLSGQQPDDAFDAWGDMGDEDDSFFDAPTSRKRSPEPKITARFDHKGEPDFAGWLAAQSQAKSKKPLPKGLAKVANVRPSIADRPTSTGTIGSGPGPKKLLSTISASKVAVPVKKIDTKPQEIESTDDGWGDNWD